MADNKTLKELIQEARTADENIREQLKAFNALSDGLNKIITRSIDEDDTDSEIVPAKAVACSMLRGITASTVALIERQLDVFEEHAKV